jgi:hypothetical protein
MIVILRRVATRVILRSAATKDLLNENRSFAEPTLSEANVLRMTELPRMT